MATSPAPKRRLPANPSEEHLRKQAKRLAKAQDILLAAAQRRLAADYGYRNWAALIVAVNGASKPSIRRSALSDAAARADAVAIKNLLADGQQVEGEAGEINTPLWYACDSDAPAERRLVVAGLLLDAGASPRQANEGNATALHAAARRGPLALVELVIRRGGLSWQGDRRGKTPLDYARKGTATDRGMIAELLDRPVIRDPRFRAAVKFIHAGNVAGLGRLLDEHPDLLGIRAVEPDCYPQDYFRDPKLFWFIANNPTVMRRMPANIVAIAQTMIARGVDQPDLGYALELVMTNGQPEGQQAALIATLLKAGAVVTPNAIVMTLAHWCLEPVEMLLARGHTMTAPIAAAFDRRRDLAVLLKSASAEDRQLAFGLAVINRRLDAARMCLDAGADPNQFLPVHRHSRPLHQAATNDDVPMLKLLVDHGAQLDTRDTLWNGTPLGWAVHGKKAAAEAFLRSLQPAPA